jgi:thiol:disulfide interchange protein DsbA
MKKFLIVLILMLFPYQSFGAEKLSGKYELIGDINKAFGKDQVTMVEFFNFSCGHCYKFLKSSEALSKKYGDKIIHKKVPIFWGKQTPYPAIAFYLAKEKGNVEELTKAMFDSHFKNGAPIFDPQVVNMIISEIGMPVDIRRQEYLFSKVQDGISLARKNSANETPTVVLNGVIKVTPTITGGNVQKMTENLDVIIQDLLSK